VERAQGEVRLRHLRGEREAHRLARGFARLELGARCGGVRAQAPEKIELVGDVQRRAVVAVLGRDAGKRGSRPRGDLLPAARGLGADARPEEGVRLAEEPARIVEARGRYEEIAVVRERLV